MSFINYYQKRDEFDYELMMYCVICVTMGVLIIWYIWALNYRYSSERIADKLLKKYDGIVQANQTIIANNGQISLDKSKASAEITVTDNNLDASVVSQNIFTLPINDKCSPLSKTCISL